jgi:diguanylate cyclase (GGDEF)-like protein
MEHETPILAFHELDIAGMQRHADAQFADFAPILRLQRALRGNDFVGRLGGDEFLVLLSRRTRRVDIDALVLRLRSTMAEPIIARGHRIEVNASIGVTELTEGDHRTPEAVLHDADLAMYRAKPAGHREGTVTKGRRPNNTHAS